MSTKYHSSECVGEFWTAKALYLGWEEKEFQATHQLSLLLSFDATFFCHSLIGTSPIFLKVILTSVLHSLSDLKILIMHEGITILHCLVWPSKGFFFYKSNNFSVVYYSCKMAGHVVLEDTDSNNNKLFYVIGWLLPQF